MPRQKTDIAMSQPTTATTNNREILSPTQQSSCYELERDRRRRTIDANGAAANATINYEKNGRESEMPPLRQERGRETPAQPPPTQQSNVCKEWERERHCHARRKINNKKMQQSKNTTTTTMSTRQRRQHNDDNDNNNKTTMTTRR